MKRSPLRRMSKAKSKEHRKYLKLKDETFSEFRYCEWPDGCGQMATQVHHAKGRSGSLLCDKNFWWLLCVEHHAWIHDHPNKARQIEGLLLI